MEVFKRVWPMALVVALNFLVTLSLFPGLTSQMTSPNFTDQSGWYPIILITLFNCFDFIGRTAPRWDAAIFIGPRMLWVPTLLRLIFIPGFIFCLHHLYFFTSDFMGYLTMSLMALTNGYFGTLAMMYGPANVDAVNKERAGTIMVFFLTAGLTAGVWTGVLFNGLFGQQSTIIHGGRVY
uniref:Equilibrative nucleoside transporter 1 n=1 Tax=Bicosoecida sp. CB-2014 TaxID=1486930 RepID=A0A7S1CGA6_9STRA